MNSVLARTSSRAGLAHILDASSHTLDLSQHRVYKTVKGKFADGVVASAIAAHRKHVDELRRRVAHVHPVNRTERKAKSLVLSSLGHTVRGLAELEAGYRARTSDPAHKTLGQARTRHFVAAVAQFKQARAPGKRARRLLHCQNTCRILL
jgi:hypothetical protein